MVRVLCGFLAGLAVATGAWRLLVREPARRAADGGPARPGSPAAAPAAVEAPPAELARLEAEIRALEAEVAGLRRAPGPAAAEKHDLGKLAARLVEAFADDSWIWDTDDARTQELMGRYLAALHEEARRLGISIEEMAWSPSGVPALGLAMLAARKPPPDEATMAKLREEVAAAGKDWNEYLSRRGGMSRLERYERMLDYQDRLGSAVDPILDEDQGMTWWNAREFWGQARPSGYADFWSEYTDDRTATIAETSGRWTGLWARDLGLDEAQKLSLRPIVDEYARAVAALNSEADRRNAGTPDRHAAPSQRELLSAMIRTMKRIGTELELTPAQRELLQNWSEVPSHSLRDTR